MKIKTLALTLGLVVFSACSPPAATQEEPADQVLVESTAVVNEAEVSENATVPIEVTYFTPAQGEGPYYTIDKPADRDNDLTAVAGVSGLPAGTVIEFSGTVYDAAGFPLIAAVIQIWQTDNNGVYLHPQDRDTDSRDPNFQFYGEAITDGEGRYQFRTILPGRYEPRPAHIHFKVFVAGEEALTSQFYFEGDSSLQTDGLVQTAGDDLQHLIIILREGQDSSGSPILIGERDIILNIE
jgi:protocatechuate 3,4-dioxygenase beta subunit